MQVAQNTGKFNTNTRTNMWLESAIHWALHGMFMFRDVQGKLLMFRFEITNGT